jgi:hypothetical protein
MEGTIPYNRSTNRKSTSFWNNIKNPPLLGEISVAMLISPTLAKKRENAMHHQRLTTTFFYYFMLIFMLALAACSTTGQQGAISSSTVTPLSTDGTPKGPGSAALTATALATPVASHCQVPALTSSANTQGWQTYTDPHYSFHFAFPATWKVGVVPASSADGSYTYYTVVVLPPTGHTPNEQSAITEPEHIELTIVLTGAVARFSNESSWTPETALTTLNTIPVKLSYRFSPECGEFDRGTDPVTFGSHPYFFYMSSRVQATIASDSQTFLAMLRSFSYTGVA